MKVTQIDVAVKNSGFDRTTVCTAVNIIIPVLEELAKSQSGWKFWLKWGMNALIAILREYTKLRCGVISE